MKHFPPSPPSLEIGEELQIDPCTRFTSVFSGELESEPVIVKKIGLLAFDAVGEMADPEKIVSSYAEEFQKLQALSHHHVLSMKGAFYSEALQGLLVVLEGARKSLRSFLISGHDEVSYETQLQLSLGLILGVDFLHSCNPPATHGNLNDETVVLTEEDVLKIDLGESILHVDHANMSPEVLRYLPPEAFTHTYAAQVATDVFSLGVLLLQIATQRAPSVERDRAGLIPELDRRMDDLEKLDDRHPLKPIILQCLQQYPRDRPSVALLLLQVQSLIDSQKVS